MHHIHPSPEGSEPTLHGFTADQIQTMAHQAQLNGMLPQSAWQLQEGAEFLRRPESQAQAAPANTVNIQLLVLTALNYLKRGRRR